MLSFPTSFKTFHTYMFIYFKYYTVDIQGLHTMLKYQLFLMYFFFFFFLYKERRLLMWGNLRCKIKQNCFIGSYSEYPTRRIYQ